VPLQASQTAKVRSPLLVLLAAVGVLLMVACANVANFQMAQASRRARELAVRSALGADRWRLVRQFVIETCLLSGAGGIMGVFIAVGGESALNGMPLAGPHAAVNAAIHGPAMTAAREYAGVPMRVVNVSPGAIDTEFTESATRRRAAHEVN
jgi:NAD(P)-dependent dehydrogenase (short-subunit alcohol dehydrogenase family)